MKLSFPVFLLSSILFLSSALKGGEEAFLEIKDRLREKNLKMNFVKFDFEKRTLLKVTGDTTVTKGRAVFLKPGFYKIVTKSPAYQELVSDGKIRYFYSKKNKQVIITSRQAGALPDFNSIVAEYIEKYDWKEVKDNEKEFEILIENKVKKETCALKISRENYAITEIKTETEAVRTLYKLKNITESETGESAEFTGYKPPRGAEIITE